MPAAARPTTSSPARTPAGNIDVQRRAEEIKALRWGLFISWSFSTFSGKDYTPGVKDVSFFRATGCDVEQWVRTAKGAEMGYILFLTKHHDGFCLWDANTTDRKVTRSPLGRDVLADLRKACDRHDMRLALYYSEGDWTWPEADANKPRGGGRNPETKMAEIKELLTGYGPIEFLWFDHAAGDGGLSHEDTARWVQRLQPGCFVGFNTGTAAGNLRLGKLGRPASLKEPAGAGQGAKSTQGYDGYLLAEFTYPIQLSKEGGALWFYSPARHNGPCVPASRLYEDYVGAVRCGNIFSIDVGPDHAGRLREIDVRTLREVGRMIREKAPTTRAGVRR